jgi:hypothetical protein
MSSMVSEGYTASLCHLIGSVPVPYELTTLVARDDEEAKLKAGEWATTVSELVDEDTLLVVKQGGRGICITKK